MISTQSRRPVLDYAANRKVLKAIGRYYYLSGRQVADLLYDRNSEASRKYAKARLKELTDAGLIVPANAYDRGAVTGGDPWVWSRTEKGRNALDRMGYPSPVAVPKHQKLAPETIGHLKLVNDTLIAFERFGRETPGVRILTQRHDYELKSEPLAGKVLDGYIGYYLERYQAPLGIAIEVDRGTERRYDDKTGAASIDDAIRRLLDLASGPHYEAFGIKSIRFAWVVQSIKKSSNDRLRDLLVWTEGALETYATGEWGASFFFTIADPSSMSVSEFISGNHWVQPFTYQHVPLVAL